MQAEFEEELLGFGSFLIETGPKEKPDMQMFVKLSEGVALPCAHGTEAPATGYVSVDNGGMIRLVEADVVMSVFCGTDEEMLDKPRVVAKSVLTVKALFESQVFANIYESMQEFAFQTAEVTVCAIQGHNGWYWDMKLAFSIDMYDVFKFKGELGVNSRFGLPTDTAKIGVEISFDIPRVSFAVAGEFVLGSICRAIDGDRALKFVGKLDLDLTPLPELHLDVSVDRSCPQYNEAGGHTIDYVITADITGFELIKDAFMINSGRLEVKYMMDETMRNKGIWGYIEGNVSAMGDVADPDVPFDVGASADIWAKVFFQQVPNEHQVMQPLSVSKIEFHALFALNVFTSTGDDANSTDVSGFKLSAEVKGEYPCTTQASGAVSLAIDIGGAMKMGFGLHGTVVFYCKVVDATKPKFEAHVTADVSLDFVEGLVIDGLFIDAIGFHDVEHDSWNAKGTVGGKVAMTSGDIGGTIGASVKFTFDTATGYWSVVAGMSYSSPNFNMTVDVGTETLCTELGTFVDGHMTLLLPIPAMDTVPEPGKGSINGVVRCGDAAVEFGKYQLRASVETMTLQVDQVVVYIKELSLDVDVLIPEGKDDSITDFAEYDFHVRAVGRILLGTDFEFPGAELLNALTPDLGMDLYGELIGGELVNVSITLVAMIQYTLPADEGSWQESLGVDKLNIWSYLRISYPCPDDGIAMNGDINLEANFDSFSISKGTGTIKYDCSEHGRIDVTAHIGTIAFQTGGDRSNSDASKFQIRSVDFELHIEKGAPALGVLWGEVDAPSDGAGARHALAAPSADLGGDYSIAGKISGIFTPTLASSEVEGQRGLQILVSINFDLPAHYSLVVNVRYTSNMVHLDVTGRIDLDFSNPDQLEFCDIDMAGHMKLKLFDDGSDVVTSQVNTLNLTVAAGSRCPRSDGISKYAIQAGVNNWSFLDGMLTGKELEVHGKVWTYGECQPDFVTARGTTSADLGRMRDSPGLPLQGSTVDDARQVRLFSGVAVGRALDAQNPVTCGHIVPDTRNGTKSPSASASFWVFVSCQPKLKTVKFIALTVNVLEGKAYVQATGVAECVKNCPVSTSTSAKVASYFRKPTPAPTALHLASSSEGAGLGVKHVKWETFTTADCDALKAPGSTDVYFSVEAVDAEIDTTKFFSGGGSMFTATASMYANISTFGHTALTLDYLTIVVTVELTLGADKVPPTFKIGGTLNYTYPCTHGMDVLGTNIHSELNVATFHAAGMINVTYPCEARVDERQLKLVGYIDEISIEGQKIFDVKYDVEAFFDQNKIPAAVEDTADLTAAQYAAALGLKGFISGKAAVGGGGVSLGADVTFIFDSIAGTVTIAATITFQSEYFDAVIKAGRTTHRPPRRSPRTDTSF